MVKLCKIMKNISEEIINIEHKRNVSIALLKNLNQEKTLTCVTCKMRHFLMTEMNY